MPAFPSGPRHASRLTAAPLAFVVLAGCAAMPDPGNPAGREVCWEDGQDLEAMTLEGMLDIDPLGARLHTTDGRTGVLIFVSVAERYAEIIADAAIHARVPAGEWKAIVDSLTGLIAEGRPGDGFVEAVNSVGACLAQHFPPGAVDPNQLPNHLIVLGEP